MDVTQVKLASRHIRRKNWSWASWCLGVRHPCIALLFTGYSDWSASVIEADIFLPPRPSMAAFAFSKENQSFLFKYNPDVPLIETQVSCVLFVTIISTYSTK